MKIKQKWMYVWGGMCLGCIFTLMGFILATAVQDVTAQNLETGTVKFDKVECRKLNIVDDTGKAWIELWFDDDGGFVLAKGKEGESLSRLGNDESGGFVGVKDRAGRYKSMSP